MKEFVIFCYSSTVNDDQVKPRSLRFTWSMKTTSSRDPNEIMAEIRKVIFNFVTYCLCVLGFGEWQTYVTAYSVETVFISFFDHTFCSVSVMLGYGFHLVKLRTRKYIFQ